MAVAVDHLRNLDDVAPAGRGCQRPSRPVDAPRVACPARLAPARTRPGRAVPLRYRRRRSVLGAVLVAVVAVVGAGPLSHRAAERGGGAAQADAGAPRPAVLAPVDGSSGAGLRAVVVPPGASVWEVVAPYTPERMAVQDWVALVVEANGLDAATVPAGTLVRLP